MLLMINDYRSAICFDDICETFSVAPNDLLRIIKQENWMPLEPRSYSQKLTFSFPLVLRYFYEQYKLLAEEKANARDSAEEEFRNK